MGYLYMSRSMSGIDNDVKENTINTFTKLNTFNNVAPKTGVAPTSNDDIANKLYVDNTSGGSDNTHIQSLAFNTTTGSFSLTQGTSGTPTTPITTSLDGRYAQLAASNNYTGSINTFTGEVTSNNFIIGANLKTINGINGTGQVESKSLLTDTATINNLTAVNPVVCQSATTSAGQLTRKDYVDDAFTTLKTGSSTFSGNNFYTGTATFEGNTTFNILRPTSTITGSNIAAGDFITRRDGDSLYPDINDVAIKNATNAFTGSNTFNTTRPTSLLDPSVDAPDGSDFITKNDGDSLYSNNSGVALLAANNTFTGTNTFETNSFTITAGTSGDCVLTLEADTDNSDENDNPRIDFFQDGGILKGAVGFNLGVSGTVNNHLQIATTGAGDCALIFAVGGSGNINQATEKIRITTSAIEVNEALNNNDTVHNYGTVYTQGDFFVTKNMPIGGNATDFAGQIRFSSANGYTGHNRYQGWQTSDHWRQDTIVRNFVGTRSGKAQNNPPYFECFGKIYATGYVNTSSDDRIKYNETDLSNSIEIFNQLKPQKYEKIICHLNQDDKDWIPSDASWNSIKNETDASGDRLFNYIEEIGLIAQEVKKIPELAFCVEGEGYDEDGKETPLRLNYGNIFCLMIQAVKDLAQENQQLKDDIALIKSHLNL